MEGIEWQDWCEKLLSLRHGATLVLVPDRDRGDKGLDAYATEGFAYQCYCPEKPYTVRECTDKQKAKISSDLRKFCREDAIAPLLGDVVIGDWVLLTPEILSKEVLEHSVSKAQEVRERALPYAATEFRVHVWTELYFLEERERLISLGGGQLNLPELEDEDVRSGVSEIQATFVSQMREKLRKDVGFSGQGDYLEKLVQTVLAQFIRGTDHLETLRDEYPLLAKEAHHSLREAERILVLKYGGSTQPPIEVIRQVVEDVSDSLLSRLKGIREGDAEVVAWSQVARWLMECPLDFLEVAP